MSIRINDLTVRFKNGVVAVNKASLEIPAEVGNSFHRPSAFAKN